MFSIDYKNAYDIIHVASKMVGYGFLQKTNKMFVKVLSKSHICLIFYKTKI